MRKNWLARLQANVVARGAAAALGRWFRSRPVVPDAAFQGPAEPYPGHWRRFPRPWPSTSPVQVRAAFDELPEGWREVLLRHDGAVRRGTGRHAVDQVVAAELGLTVAVERDLLTRARAALREGVQRAHEAGRQ